MSSWGDILTEQLGGDILMDQQHFAQSFLDCGARQAQHRGGLEAVVVVDNVACGAAIGGVRMAPDVTLEEVCRLARAMTFKNAAADLPHGGGKSGIIARPTCPPPQKKAPLP